MNSTCSGPLAPKALELVLVTGPPHRGHLIRCSSCDGDLLMLPPHYLPVPENSRWAEYPNLDSRTVPFAWIAGAANRGQSYEDRVTTAARVFNPRGLLIQVREGIEGSTNCGAIGLWKSRQPRPVVAAPTRCEQSNGENSSGVSRSALHRGLPTAGTAQLNNTSSKITTVTTLLGTARSKARRSRLTNRLPIRS